MVKVKDEGGMMNDELDSDYSDIEQNLKIWAENTPDVKSIFIVGSYSKKSEMTIGSDLDIVVVTSGLSKYKSGKINWSQGIGKVIFGQFQPTNHMIFEQSFDYYIIFDKERDVDFSFISEKDFKREMFLATWFINFPKLFPQSLETLIRKRASAFYSGSRFIYDSLLLEKQVSNTFSRIAWSFSVPLPDQFISSVDNFLVYSFKTARKIQSKKYFQAKWMLETTLTYQFITLAEWHIRSQKKIDSNVRLRDLALDKWADARVKADLMKINPAYDFKGLQNSLLSLINLFYWVCAETAQNFGYSDAMLLGVDHFEYVKQYIESLNTGE